MLKKEDFLKKFNIEPEEYDRSMSWDELTSIFEDYKTKINSLDRQAEFVSNTLRMNKKIHTVRSRVKDPEHLIEKLIRKLPDRKESKGQEFVFSIENYMSEITDLIGVRAIHIFKEDWREIHDFIMETWDVKEVSANIREGDDTRLFQNTGISIDTRTSGYRSVHYLIELSATLKKTIVEIQVRTIFEEGYGEIDHLIRYPHDKVPDVLALNLLVLNRIAGSSDEIASFINLLRINLLNIDEELKVKDQEINELKNKIQKLEIAQKDKDTISKSLDKFGSHSISSALNLGIAPLLEGSKSIFSWDTNKFSEIEGGTLFPTTLTDRISKWSTSEFPLRTGIEVGTLFPTTITEQKIVVKQSKDENDK